MVLLYPIISIAPTLGFPNFSVPIWLCKCLDKHFHKLFLNNLIFADRFGYTIKQFNLNNFSVVILVSTASENVLYDIFIMELI